MTISSIRPRNREKFLTALKQAGFYARTIVVPGAGHFWASEPLDEPGSFGAYAAPKMMRFLQAALYAQMAWVDPFAGLPLRCHALRFARGRSRWRGMTVITMSRNEL